MSQLFRLKNGTVLLSTEAPGGIYNSSQLKKIAELCSKELAIVKATEDQRLALFVKESEVEQVAAQLRTMGLGFRHYQDSLHQPVSCLGELCEEHEQPAMATAMDITKEIATIQLNAPLKIGINGCARCCTPCHTLDIAIVGDSSGYRLSLGGKTQQMPEFASYFAEAIPPKELPKRIKAVIEVFQSLAEEGETLHDVIERCGVADFVQALAPYSQDAAPRVDPFAGDAESSAAVTLDHAEEDFDLESSEIPESIAGDDELDLEAGLSEDAVDEVALDDDLTLSELDEDPITLDGDNNSGHLDEIPIDQGNHGSLEDDLAMDDLEGDMAIEAKAIDEPLAEDLVSEAPEDDLDLESLEVDDESVAATVTAEEDLMLNDEAPLDQNLEMDESEDLALDNESLGLDDLEVLELSPQTEDELDLSAEEPELMEFEESSVETSEGDDLLLESEDENVTTENSDDELSLDAADDDLQLDLHADIPEDDLELDDSDLDVPEMDLRSDSEVDEVESFNEGSELELDESDSLEDELPSDLDESALTQAEPMLDEDLEGIPELDEDLALDELPAPTSPKAKPAADLNADFDDDLPSDVPDLSDEEESQFERKLHESIDEESRMIAKQDKDPNKGDRQAALNLLEQPEDLGDEDVETISEASVDDELEPISEDLEEFSEPEPQELSQIKSRQVGQKIRSEARSQEFKFSGIRFEGEHMRVTFVSGAYVDFDLSALGMGEERNFTLGEQSVSVTSTSEGYILEVDGMRLFHPKSSLPVAS